MKEGTSSILVYLGWFFSGYILLSIDLWQIPFSPKLLLSDCYENKI